MNRIIIFSIFFFFLLAKGTKYEFTKLEYCKSSNITLSVEKCQLEDTKIGIVINIFKPATQVNVEKF